MAESRLKLMQHPKFRYIRSKALLKAVASLPCQLCGHLWTQAAHSNQAIHGKGRGIKASDIYTAALCQHHHYEIDQGKELSKQDRIDAWNYAHQKTVAELLERNMWPKNIPLPTGENP